MGYTKLSWVAHFGRKFKNFDVVVLAATKKDVLEQYIKIAEKLAPTASVVFVDGGDESKVGGDFKRLGCYDLFEKARNLRDFDWIFKREMLINEVYAPNVSSMPFAFNFDWLDKLKEVTEKKYEVAFWGVDSHPVRKKALELIRGKWDCDENGTGVHPSIKTYERKGTFYLEELKACKIALHFRGSGWDTLRFWEIPAMGSFMISPKPGIEIPNMFLHELEAVYCADDLSDLENLCNYYLKNDRLREKIARNGLSKMYLHHQDKHRARELLKFAQ